MAYDTVLVEKSDDHVGTIILNRPDLLNTFSSVMAFELDQALLELDNDPNLRVIIIKGAGRGIQRGYRC